MKNLRIQVWEGLENLFYPTRYKYPGSNLPKNHQLEGEALQKFLPPFCNGIFLDYGCGEGVMFTYIKKYYKHFPPLIVGIDPDYSRLIKAKRLLLKERGKGIFLNTTFDHPVFRKKSLRGTLSCIICIQVFGHIPEHRLTNTLRTFYFLLEHRGILIIAIPFINDDFSFPGWGNKTDLICLINTSRKLQDPARKTVLNEKSFPSFADHPVANLLPVRRFFINGKAKVGYKCDENLILASRLGENVTQSGFNIKGAIVYKVKSEKGSGDLMLSLSPNKL